MRRLLFISLLIVYRPAFAVDIDIDKVRTLYQQAATDGNVNKEMLLLLADVNEKNPLLLGYKASATMMMAKNVFSPFSKLSYFNKGKNMLERAIEIDAGNVELRFLRLLIQENSPKFLGYVADIESDKHFILNNIVYMKDTKSKQFVVRVLNESKGLNLHEKIRLNR